MTACVKEHRRNYIEARGGSCLLLIFSFLHCSEINKQTKIIKIVATSCQILKIKCTKFDFGWGSAPDPAGGAHSAPQIP